MSILLLGATGQVGHALHEALAPLGPVIAPRRDEADLADEAGLVALVRAHAPRVVVNAAAYTAVDRAEAEPARARQANALGPATLAAAAHEAGALMIHYSSDYVFDGSGSTPWREDDPVAPLNAYGRSKAEGEALVRLAAPNHLIFRTSWVHAPGGHNFISALLAKAQDTDRLDLVDDQWGAPTSAALVAGITARALAAAPPLPPGTYHLAAAGETSWHLYAAHLLEGAQQRRPDRKWARTLRPVATRDWPAPAPRPFNSRLDTGKLSRALGIDFPDWREGVDATLDALLGRVPA